LGAWFGGHFDFRPRIIIARPALSGHFGHSREVEMRKHVLLLTTTAAILTCGVAASAQGPGTPIPGGPMMQHHDQDDWHHGEMMDHGRGSSVVMRIIFGLMDANGDGKLSLEEFQAAHERIFKAMDADHDGTVTFEEMQAFIRGH
jgi:EF hand